jgi:hypothetical protein
MGLLRGLKELVPGLDGGGKEVALAGRTIRWTVAG